MTQILSNFNGNNNNLANIVLVAFNPLSLEVKAWNELPISFKVLKEVTKIMKVSKLFFPFLLPTSLHFFCWYNKLKKLEVFH